MLDQLPAGQLRSRSGLGSDRFPRRLMLDLNLARKVFRGQEVDRSQADRIYRSANDLVLFSGPLL